jgi:uncharacterized membrane protein YoaT (DUF817 family)
MFLFVNESVVMSAGYTREVTTLPATPDSRKPSGLAQSGLFLWLGTRSCVFALCVFAALAVSQVFTFGLPRYDFLFASLVIVQGMMYALKLETLEEIKFITLFHLVGFVLEQFKTHVGSWAYPEFGFTKIAGVPLYSGFMYAAVGSCIAQAWRLMRVTLHAAPRGWVSWSLGALIYLNFFTNAVLPDARYPLMLGVLVVYWRTRLEIRLGSNGIHRAPVALLFAGLGALIWVAENIATYFGAWVYPYQTDGWRIVDLSKVSSWMLLVIISFILVQHLKKKAK